MSNPRKSGPEFQYGFTLVELIMTMLIIAILAVVAAPRFTDSNAFQSRGFADQVQATLRYAQKVAIAQRRYVCATFTASQLALTIGSTSGCVDANLNLPTGSVNYIDAPSGVTISPVPANFNFNAQGKPSFVAAQSITVSGYGTPITVEAETGYVH